MNISHTADFATRLKGFQRRCIAMIVFYFIWLFVVGFLLLYICSLIDPRSVSGFARTAIVVPGVAILLLPFMIGKGPKKLRQKYGLVCRSCGGDLAANKEVIQHVLETSICPYCEKSLKDLQRV